MATKSIGTVFSFAVDGGEPVTVGKLSAISEMACDSELIDITTLEDSDGCRHYMQGARDLGELRLTGFHADDAGQAALRAAYQSGQQISAVIAFPDGLRVTFPALVKGISLGAATVDGAVGFGCRLRATGAVAFTRV